MARDGERSTVRHLVESRKADEAEECQHTEEAVFFTLVNMKNRPRCTLDTGLVGNIYFRVVEEPGEVNRAASIA